MLKKTLIGLGAFLVLLLFVAALFVNRISVRALPDYNAELQIRGLQEKVTVYRDKLAVPHIYADNEDDLYLATGYLAAQERMWQMDLLRRVTIGRLSEIFGADMVKVDKLMRALRISDKSRSILEQSDPAVVRALNMFTKGVNLYIEDHQKKLPPEFFILGYSPEPWEAWHSVNLIGYMAWDLTMPYGVETILGRLKGVLTEAQYRELLPEPALQSSTVYPAEALAQGGAELMEGDMLQLLGDVSRSLENWGIQLFEGSNNWALGPQKSSSGAPIFCNDMHLGLNAPGIWMRMHQNVPGKLDVTGVMVPGQPFIVAGHNADIAWGMTNVMVDDMDFYEEQFDDAGETYLYRGEWLPVERVEEVIRIKGGTDTLVVNRFTHRGPVISDLKGFGERMVTMTWTGNLFSNELAAVHGLNRARNWDEFRAAVRDFRSVSQNVNYADRNGNIGLQNCAGIPIRPEGMSGIEIYPGTTDAYDWKGVVPFEEQLYIYNPESGYVSSANNKTAVNDYPYPVSHWFALHYRIDRIREFIDEREQLSVTDMMALQSDVNSHFVRELKPFFLESLNRAEGLSEKEQALRDRLARWNGAMLKDIAEAPVFELSYLYFVENMLSDEMGELYPDYIRQTYLPRYFVNNLVRGGYESAWSDDGGSEGIETQDDIVLRSFRQAIAEMEERAGKDPAKWQWGEEHQLTLSHPLGSVKILDRLFGFNRGPWPAPGSFHTVAPYAYRFSDSFPINHGASQRHIFTPDDWDNSFSILPTGNSGIPASDHYCDQTDMYMNFEYQPDLFSLERIREAAVYVQELRP